MSSQPLDPTPILMSGAALPNLPAPPGDAPVPATADPEGPRPGRGRKWLGLVAVGAAVAAGYWGWTKKQERAATATVVVTRSAAVERGVVRRSLRLTGSTTAERFSSLIAPTLRGRRNPSNGSAAAATTQTASAGNMLQSTASTVSSGGSNASANGTVSSTAGAGGGTTLRSARSASGARASSASSRSSSSGSANSAAGLAAANLGSTANQLVGSGGGGGGNDFTLVLQDVVDNGVTVTKGQKLAEFDRQYMLLRLDDFRASVVQSEQDFKRQMAELEITRKAYEQQVTAARNQVEKAELDIQTLPVRSAIQSEQLKLALEEAKANLAQQLKARPYLDIGEKAQVKTAQLDLQQSKVELRRAENNANQMIAEAPIGGLVVMQSMFRGGEFGAIQQGDQVYPGQMFMQIVDPSSMIVNATVNQADVQALRIGQKAKIRFDAFPDLELPGRLVMIGAMTKAGGSRGQFKKDVPVRFALEQMDPRVIPDLTVSADVEIGESAEGVTVPLEAVHYEPGAAGDEAARPFVYVRDRGGRWQRRTVELGVASYVRAAVRSGLTAGDVVALETPPAAAPGDGQEQPRG